MSRPGRSSERRALGLSVAAGLATFVAVMTAGVLLFVTGDNEVSASSSLIVVPATGIPDDAIAGYYETLSRGQVIATYAEIMREGAFDDTAADALELTSRQRADLSVEVRVVPDTALIEVEVTGPEHDTATAMANTVARESVTYVRSLGQPYLLRQVTKATESSEVGVSTTALVAVVLVVGLVAGLGAQQFVFQVWQLLSGEGDYRRRRGASTASV